MTLSITDLGDVHGLLIEVPITHLELFRTLIQRGINTWADAPADMKIACDLILYGKALQDYKILSGNLT